MSKTNLYPALIEKLENLKSLKVSLERKEVLKSLIEFIQKEKNEGNSIQLNFICTHNSRRSQFGQVWAQAISDFYGIEINCYSGGTEETAFNQIAIDALNRAGFKTDSASGENPKVQVQYSEDKSAMECYSKVYDAEENPSKNFAAVMTCSHADENCPFIPGSKARIALDYSDPKKYDDTPLTREKYDERSDQIASEMIYVFENIR